jgi:Putative transposase/Transposase zinc-binding domain
MGATDLEVADILRRYGDAYRQHVGGLAPRHERVIRAIEQCRTAALGGHLYVCNECGVVTERYNSCCNRHCPKCQWLDRQKWIEKRREELLPVTYFHVVFTVPDDLLNPLFRRNQKTLYNLLFGAVAQTLLEIAADPEHLGARIGFVAVLHTWGQLLQDHVHLHCIVPGGGLSPEGDRWVFSREDFFVHVKVLSRLLRGKLLAGLKKLAEDGELRFPHRIDPTTEPHAYQSWLDQLYGQEWVVYSKPPFGGSEHGIGYLARYTHRVAISNDRLLGIEDDRVHFRYKDYKHDGEWKQSSLHVFEFLRRFLLHVLPDGFQRIRYYGLLAHRCRAANLERCRTLLALPAPAEPAESDSEDEETWEQRLLRLTGIDPTICPICGQGRLVFLQTVEAQPQEPSAISRGPPS